MSQSDKANDGGELACKYCGETGFGNAGALARHEQACEAGGESPEQEPGDGAGFKPSDMLACEIREACERATDAELDATVERLDYTPVPEDTREDAAAKALVRAKDGGKEMFVSVFDECEHPDCDYGANGIHAAYCKRHAASQEREDTGESADTDTDTRESDDGSGSHDGVQLAAELFADGVPAERAAKAVQAAESVSLPDSWAGVYGGVLDRVASPEKAKAFADAVYPDA